MPPVNIRQEQPQDRAAIWRVNHDAFDRDDEADLVDALRDGGWSRLSMVAEVESAIVGHVLFSQLIVRTERGDVPGLALAPMAVLPQFQRQGIGSRLVRHALELCRQDGHRFVIVLGHPEFYPRFGFSSALAKPLRSPFTGDVWMAMELEPGALAGVAGDVIYAPPFGLDPA
jgi:putative acetyltransferase